MKPYLIKKDDLKEGYLLMSKNNKREGEAKEWTDFFINDYE